MVASMNWEAHVLLPLLAILCAVYVYLLFVKEPGTPSSNIHAFTHVVVPHDSREEFDRLVERLRVDQWGWKPQKESHSKSHIDDFFLALDDPAQIQKDGKSSFLPITPSNHFTCKSGYITIKSLYNYKFLWTHGEEEGWVSAQATLDTAVCEKAFQVVPVSGNCGPQGWVTLRPALDSSYVYTQAAADENPFAVQVYPLSVSTPTDVHPIEPKDPFLDARFHFVLENDGFIFSRAVNGCVNVMSETKYTVRAMTQGWDRTQPAGREFSAGVQLQWVNESDVNHCIETISKVTAEDTLADKSMISQIISLPHSNERRYISFGLYGSAPKYTMGAIKNAILAPTYFPGWKLRYYVLDDVPSAVIDKLKSFPYVEIATVPKSLGTSGGMFWRFTIADDPQVDRFIVRDVDSRLNARDRLAVQEWIESGVGVHSIRDHVNHCFPMNGGMWGARRNAIKDMSNKVNKWIDTSTYGADLRFLQEIIWPEIRNDQLSHDAYCCEMYPNAKPFPTKRLQSYAHVGQVFDEWDRPRMFDIDGYIRNVPIPAKCRRNNEWLYG